MMMVRLQDTLSTYLRSTRVYCFLVYSSYAQTPFYRLLDLGRHTKTRTTRLRTSQPDLDRAGKPSPPGAGLSEPRKPQPGASAANRGTRGTRRHVKA